MPRPPEPQKLRHDRAAWVAFLRRQHLANEEERRHGDGFSQRVIPFGAAQSWQEEQARYLAEALSRPLPARVVGGDEAGLVLAVSCPFCGAEHEHQVSADGWEPGRAHEAHCGKGAYRLTVAE